MQQKHKAKTNSIVENKIFKESIVFAIVKQGRKGNKTKRLQC